MDNCGTVEQNNEAVPDRSLCRDVLSGRHELPTTELGQVSEMRSRKLWPAEKSFRPKGPVCVDPHHRLKDAEPLLFLLPYTDQHVGDVERLSEEFADISEF